MRSRMAAAGFLLLTVQISLGQVQKQPQVPRFDAAAIVKLISVRVLDLEGRPIAGLKREDFRLTDNGQSQKITEFEVHVLASPEPRREALLPEDATSNIHQAGRKFFLFFDIQGSDINGMANAKEAAFHFIDTQLRPEDEVGVLSYAPMTGLSIKEYLTSDKDKIRKAVVRAREVPPSPGFTAGTEAAAGEQQAVREWEQKRAERALESGESFQRSGGGGYYNTISVPGLSSMSRKPKDYMASIEETAKALKYIPGPVNVLMFSARRLPVGLARAFAAANIPVFVVQTQNWKIDSIINLSIKKKYIWVEHPLKEFALATGGQYFADIEDRGGIAEGIQALSGNYYVLGYYIPESWDGKYHKIKVTVDRPDCRVFVQEGYSNPLPYAQRNDIEKKLHLYELIYGDTPALRQAAELDVDLLEVPGMEGRTVFMARVPVDAKSGASPGKTEFHAVVFDQTGAIAASARGETDFTGFDQRVYHIFLTARLLAGEHEFRFITRDALTGQSAVGRMVFRAAGPGPEKPPGISLSTPLLFIPGSDGRFLNLDRPLKKDTEPASIGKFYAIFPKGHIPLVGPAAEGTKRVIAVLPAEIAEGLIRDFRLAGVISPIGGGSEAPLVSRIVLVKHLSQTRTVLAAEIDLPDLFPGEYSLKLTVSDAGGNGRASVAKILKIGIANRP